MALASRPKLAGLDPVKEELNVAAEHLAKLQDAVKSAQQLEALAAAMFSKKRNKRGSLKAVVHNTLSEILGTEIGQLGGSKTAAIAELLGSASSVVTCLDGLAKCNAVQQLVELLDQRSAATDSLRKRLKTTDAKSQAAAAEQQQRVQMARQLHSAQQKVRWLLNRQASDAAAKAGLQQQLKEAVEQLQAEQGYASGLVQQVRELMFQLSEVQAATDWERQSHWHTQLSEEALQSQLEWSRQEMEVLRGALRHERDQAAVVRAGLEAELAAEKQRVEGLQRQLEEAQEAVESLRVEAECARAEVADLRHELEAVRSEAACWQADARAAECELEETAQEVARLKELVAVMEAAEEEAGEQLQECAAAVVRLGMGMVVADREAAVQSERADTAEEELLGAKQAVADAEVMHAQLAAREQQCRLLLEDLQTASEGESGTAPGHQQQQHHQQQQDVQTAAEKKLAELEEELLATKQSMLNIQANNALLAAQLASSQAKLHALQVISQEEHGDVLKLQRRSDDEADDQLITVAWSAPSTADSEACIRSLRPTLSSRSRQCSFAGMRDLDEEAKGVLASLVAKAGGVEVAEGGWQMPLVAAWKLVDVLGVMQAGVRKVAEVSARLGN